MTEDLKAGDEKICGVCGDKALGYNFNAITCESCKAFFRRNAVKTKDFKCPFNNNCKVDIITRRFCQKCRLKKCFEIGMKKEWILTDEEKRIKKTKIEENRRKRYAPYQSKREKLSISSRVKHTFSLSPSEIGVDVDSDQVVGLFVDTEKPLSNSQPNSPTTLLFDDSVELQAESISNSSELMSLTSEHGSAILSNSDFNQSVTLIPNESCNAFSSIKGKKTLACSVSSGVPPDSVIKNSKEPSTISSLVNSDLSSSSSKWSTSLSSDGVGESQVTSSTVLCDAQRDRVSPRLNGSFVSFLSERFDNHISSNLDHSCIGHYSKKDDCIIPQSVMDLAIKVEFADIPLRSKNCKEKTLTEAEEAKLTELITANEVLKMPLSCEVPDPSLLDVINMTDHAIRRLIIMSKRIHGFKTLCQEDQIALLKGGCTELMLLRSVMTYDPEKDCWQGPQAMSIKVDILKEAKGNIYEEHKRFINSFDVTWRSDENIMLLLSAITLFTPERPNIVHKNVVSLEQKNYYYLLKRYLDTIYTGCEARSFYLKLISKLQELHLLNENHVQIFLDVNPKDVEPLLIEIFDLKH
ncbi:nuclear hormone receptor HR96-like [Tachypleus tridentatus]|uniref:nuclear hormone receptor HR96-like n=1 Tax=Tachypleus tridentatus TaxID=6853 RepID=UPI003FD5469A